VHRSVSVDRVQWQPLLVRWELKRLDRMQWMMGSRMKGDIQHWIDIYSVPNRMHLGRKIRKSDAILLEGGANIFVGYKSVTKAVGRQRSNLPIADEAEVSLHPVPLLKIGHAFPNFLDNARHVLPNDHGIRSLRESNMHLPIYWVKASSDDSDKQLTVAWCRNTDSTDDKLALLGGYY